MASLPVLLVADSLAAQSGGGGLMQMVVIIVPMLAVMYFLMIRPESKRRNEHQQLISGLKRGDEVVLTSGIIGKIHAIEDKTLVIEVADKVRVKVLKVAISGPAQRYLGGAEAAKPLGDPKKDAAKDDKKDGAKDEDRAEAPETKSEKKSA
jgi:preprotein translocase subunit YajC